VVDPIGIFERGQQQLFESGHFDGVLPRAGLETGDGGAHDAIVAHGVAGAGQGFVVETRQGM
jgi:hypothetical protein